MTISKDEFMIGSLDIPKQPVSEETILETLSNWRTYIKFTTKLIMEQFNVSYYRATRVMRVLKSNGGEKL
jgi:biopolymer transport protein ExbD